MIGLDTNVLLRFYIEDASDNEAKRQHAAAAKLFLGGAILFVPKSVLLESEWVMRAVYGYSVEQVASVFHHLVELPHVRVEDAEVVDNAIGAYEGGLDFADALHHATCKDCESFATFDDRQFARRVARMQLTPACEIPKA